MRAVIAVVLLLTTLAIACASEPSERIFEDPTDPQGNLVKPTLAEQSTPRIQTSPQETTQPKLAAQTITKAELENGSDLARIISLSLISPERMSDFTGLSYAGDEFWSDWNEEPDGRGIAQRLSQTGFGSEQEIRRTLFESGYIRHLSSRLFSPEATDGCFLFQSYQALTTVIVTFETEDGAENFFQRVILDSAGNVRVILSGADFLLTLDDPKDADCTSFRNGEYVYGIDTLIFESAFLSAGPFVIIIWETSLNSDQDYDNSPLDYAREQIILLTEGLSEYSR